VDAGPGGTIFLRSPASKGWRPRESAKDRRAEHPGTAVAWDGRIHEVVEVRALAGGEVCYTLAPWREDLVIRILERYDEASEADRAADLRWRTGAPRHRRLAMLLSPILGHLPGPVQERMEHDFGAPANSMTVVSALPLFAVGVVGLLAGVAHIAGGSLAPLPEPPLPLSLYLVVESSLRLSVAVTQSRPAGSLPGAVAWELWKLVRTYNRPGGST
jgi:hypothetical protein